LAGCGRDADLEWRWLVHKAAPGAASWQAGGVGSALSRWIWTALHRAFCDAEMRRIRRPLAAGNRSCISSRGGALRSGAPCGSSGIPRRPWRCSKSSARCRLWPRDAAAPKHRRGVRTPCSCAGWPVRVCGGEVLTFHTCQQSCGDSDLIGPMAVTAKHCSDFLRLHDDGGSSKDLSEGSSLLIR
jgi:hypothetical protein